MRPLYDDGASSATAATRDYVLKVDDAGAPLLNIFGGKITTYRKLAEAAMAQIALHLGNRHGDWTAGKPLPGGDFPVQGFDALVTSLLQRYGFLDKPWATRLARAYGTDAFLLLGDAQASDQLGSHFGHEITAAELDWTITHEWVETGDDFLWRRTRLGLVTSTAEAAAIDDYIRRSLQTGKIEAAAS